MQCPGLHNTGPTHMWLLFCCVYNTILKMIITGIWRFSVTQHDAHCGPATETDCWCGGILSGKLRYIECWETRKCESVLCDYLTFWNNRQFWVFQLFRIKEPSVLVWFFKGKKIESRIREPLVTCISKTSKNQQFSWKNWQRTSSG